MPVIQSEELPHCFCPNLAKDHGLAVAIVEYASRDLSRGQDPVTCKEIKINFKIGKLLEKCFYLSKDEIDRAVTKLIDIGICNEYFTD
jgi:hypothetical protein